MRRPLTKAAFSPTLEIQQAYRSHQKYMEISGIAPYDTSLDCLQAVDLQLDLQKLIPADSMHVDFLCCDTSIHIGGDLETEADIDTLRDYVRTKNDTLRGISFTALGTVSVRYIKSAEPTLGLRWDKNHIDLIPPVANAVVDTHRYELQATAADVVHSIWLASASYQSFYD